MTSAAWHSHVVNAKAAAETFEEDLAALEHHFDEGTKAFTE
jgi:hypothetical protein